MVAVCSREPYLAMGFKTCNRNACSEPYLAAWLDETDEDKRC